MVATAANSGIASAAFVGQRELRFLPHAMISMRQQLNQFIIGSFIKPIRQQLSGFGNEWIIHAVRIKDAIDLSLFRLVPTFGPIAGVQSAARAEVDISGEHSLDEGAMIDQLVTGRLPVSMRTNERCCRTIRRENPP